MSEQPVYCIDEMSKSEFDKMVHEYSLGYEVFLYIPRYSHNENNRLPSSNHSVAGY